MIPEKPNKNDIKRIRFSAPLQREIASSVPHLRGNFSGQVKYLVGLGLKKKAAQASPAMVADLIKKIDDTNRALRQIGNNINQIAYQLNAGEQVDFPQLVTAHSALRKELASVRELLRAVRNA